MERQVEQFIQSLSDVDLLEYTRTQTHLPEALEFAHVLQDGGEIRDGILEDFGPEIWEDFQAHFIDAAS